MKQTSILAVGLAAFIGAALSINGSVTPLLAMQSSPVAVGAVFSTDQPSSLSFLRFYNADNFTGTATVKLSDHATGETVGEWTSPEIPAGASAQVSIATIEDEIGDIVSKPSYYSISVHSDFAGYLQHVLWRPSDGTLTNLSTCSAGVTANAAALINVHTSLIDADYASSVIVNNTGDASATVDLGVYDARDGTHLGAFTTDPIPAGGQAAFAASDLEAGIDQAPGASMYHYVVKAEGAFAGFLQHLVNNAQVGVVTDMTNVCALDGTSADTPAVYLQRQGSVFSTAQSSSQSFLRFYNTDEAAGAVTVSLENSSTGEVIGEWISPDVPVGASAQYSIAMIEDGLNSEFTRPDFYSISVRSDFSGSLQHVLWRPSDGTITNLSTCSAGVTTADNALINVHTSMIKADYPSSIVVNNTGDQASAVDLGVYDARDGTKLGTFTTPIIPAGAQVTLSVPTIEFGINHAPETGMYHYVVKAEGDFTGFLQHLVDNRQVGVTTDMTTVCSLDVQPAAQIYTSNIAQSRFGDPCELGETSIDGFLLVCSNSGAFRYALHEDIPAAPTGGYVERPAWYPPLSVVFRAEKPQTCPESGTVTFTHMIMPTDELTTTKPQGQMLSSHVTPTDHGYVGIEPNDIPADERTEDDYVPVYTPADGKIIELSQNSPGSIRMVIDHGCEVYTMYIVLNRLAGVLAEYEQELEETGQVSDDISVQAGDIVGEQRDNPLDFSVHDGGTWLSGYLAPFSYVGEAWKPYTVDPLPYFTSDLGAVLEATLTREQPPRWGVIDQDVAGTASGNWFLSGTVGYSGRSVEDFRTATKAIPGGAVPGKDTYAWSHLAIARHWVLPNNWVFSTGWWKDEAGDTGQFCMNLADGDPAPSDLSAEDGTVVYLLRKLLNARDVEEDLCDPFVIHGIVAVRVNDDETLSIEPVPGAESTSEFAGFSADMRTYRR